MTHEEFEKSIPHDPECPACTKDNSSNMINCCKGHMLMTINIMMDKIDEIQLELTVMDKRLLRLENNNEIEIFDDALKKLEIVSNSITNLIGDLNTYEQVDNSVDNLNNNEDK